MHSTSPHFGRILLTLVLISLLTAGALAGDDPQDPGPARAGREECRIGNLNDPVGPPVPGIFMGHESYAYYVYPPETCSCQEEGFKLESVTQGLFFDDQQIPAVFNVQVLLLRAEFDPGQNCHVPGPVIFEGPEETIVIQDNGPVLLTVPTGGTPPFVFDDHYFIGLRYQGDAPGSLLVDDMPEPCIEYIDRGNGWEDLNGFDGRGASVERAGGGKVIVYGDIICSPMSVGQERRTWDAIKSLFK